MRYFSPRDYRSQPWKNGGGTTTELVRLPHPKDPEKFLFRLSRAKVESEGPFSIFPGIERHLVLLNGSGMRLGFNDGHESTLNKPYQLLRFSGEDTIDCRLIDGPIEDFNIMVDRSWGEAEVSIVNVKAKEKYRLPCPTLTFVYQVERQLLIQAEHEVLEWDIDHNQTLIMVALRPQIDKDLKIRQLERGHTQEFFDLIQRNRSYLKQWLGWLDNIKTIEQLDDYVENTLKDISEERLFRAWIWHQNKIVGIVHLAEIDWKQGKAMVGYWVGREYSGKGLATRGAAAIIDFAFKNWQLKQIEIRCATGNIPSQRVAMKLGFQRTGHLQNNEWLYDRYVDHIVFTKNASDWA